MAKKILITGSEGFIGSHLVETLVKKGFKVKAMVLYNSFNNQGWLEDVDNSITKEIETVNGDIRDFDIVKKSMSDCDTVINLAALVGIPYSYLAPNSYVDTNIKGLLNILNASEGKKKIIHTSTSEVYGTAQTIPIYESHPLNAQSPYAATKIAADQLALSFYKSFNTPVTIIRPFNTFGPRQLLRAIIPTIITQFLDDSVKTIKLGNIDTKRNFNYVLDIADGFLKSLNAKNINGEVINLGSNYDLSIKEIIKIISKITKIKKDVVIDNKRVRPTKSEVQSLSAGNKKAKKLLKWEPKYVNHEGFTRGLELTIDWFKNNRITDKINSNKYHI